MLRVLVITYYFPPSGGSGVQRVLKTVKYLPEYGVIPEVLTVADGAYPEYDASLVEEIPPSVAVHRTRSVDPFRLYGALRGKSKQEAVKVGSVREGKGLFERTASWVRANVFLPDARVGWVPFAKREAVRLLRDKDFDVVLTSGPPHSTHLIGRYLKRKFNIPWVADFRDPWTEIIYYDELPMSTVAKRFDRRLEASVLREADHIVTVGPTLAEGLAEKGNKPLSEVSVVYNGYDAEDFLGIAPPDLSVESFSLVHVGSLFDSRDPVALWDALSRLREEDPALSDSLMVRLVGQVGENVQRSIQSRKLGNIVEMTGYVDHDEAVREMVGASVLLLALGGTPASRDVITGKLFEYLASGRPILALGRKDGAAATLLEEVGLDSFFAWEDIEGISTYLRSAMARRRQGEKLSGASQKTVSTFTREAQAGRMVEVLREAAKSAVHEQTGD